MRIVFSTLTLVLLLCLIGSASMAAETGDLKITFKLRGQVPKAKPIALIGPICGQFNHVDESVIVNPENQGIANIVVYVYVGRRGTQLDEQKPRKKVVTLANKNCRFEPHVVLMQTNDTLKVKNLDVVGHNVNLPFLANPPVNVQIPPNQFIDIVLKKPEPTLIPAVCNAHPWMKTHLLVMDHTFFAKSDQDGVLEIKGLPAGDKIIFRAWHERGTFKNQIFINDQETKWKANKFEVEIKTGMNDLGVVEVPANQF